MKFLKTYFQLFLFIYFIFGISDKIISAPNHDNVDFKPEFTENRHNPIVSNALRFLLGYAAGKALDAIIDEIYILLSEDYQIANNLPPYERNLTIDALNELENKVQRLDNLIRSNQLNYRNELISYIDENFKPLESRFLSIEKRISNLEFEITNIDGRVTVLEESQNKTRFNLLAGDFNVYPALILNFSTMYINTETISNVLNIGDTMDGPLNSFSVVGVGLNAHIGRLFSFNTTLSRVDGEQGTRNLYGSNSEQFQIARNSGRNRVNYSGISVNSDINLLLLLPSKHLEAHPADGIYLEFGVGYSFNSLEIIEYNTSFHNRYKIGELTHTDPYLNFGTGFNLKNFGLSVSKKIFNNGEYSSSINTFYMKLYLP